MAQRKPKRKKTIRLRPEKFHPLNRFYRNRVVRRAVERQKKKKGEKEWKDILFIILCILLTLAVMIALNYIARKMHEEQERQYEKEVSSVTKF